MPAVNLKFCMDMQTICYSAIEKDTGRPVLSVLKQEMRISVSMISRLKREPQGITVNGEKAYVTRTLKAGDLVRAAFPSESSDTHHVDTLPETVPTVYEDEYYLIINKPAGISVQTVQDPEEITLETYLKEYLHTDARPHMVSRLDKGTSGLMTVAKNAYLHDQMKRQMHSENYYKEYRAILCGYPAQEQGTVEAPIGFCEGSTYARCVRADGAPSVSHYEVLARRDGLSLVRLIPVTGRTHQLRVHMAYMGCPLLGDWLYGQRCEIIDRPALHSGYLRLRHPVTGAMLELTCPPPEDMEKILKY